MLNTLRENTRNKKQEGENWFRKRNPSHSNTSVLRLLGYPLSIMGCLDRWINATQGLSLHIDKQKGCQSQRVSTKMSQDDADMERVRVQ